MVTPDATLDASYPAWGIAHVGRIRRLRRIRQPLLIALIGMPDPAIGD
ncbi:hypothetical protein MLF04_10040 [Escherichia coli]|nr:hypothetical protein [Escherichia coli]